MSSVHCVIPARMASSRFPGKPLVQINGREMILRTLERAHLAACFDRVICATDSQEIADLVSASGNEVVLTGKQATGSDRVYEAMQKLNLDLVVNLQGDEPLADLDLLRDISETLVRYPKDWVTGASPVKQSDLHENSIVKVKVKSGIALDFRRFVDESEVSIWQVHRGIYAYSKKVLEEFHYTPITDREKSESIEPLRILGKRPIHIVFSSSPSISVDLPTDVEKVEAYLNLNKKSNS